jgi:hypothetical protein
MSTDSRYPVGPYARPPSIDPASRAASLKDIADLPRHLMAAITGLTDAQLDTPYREGGWTVRQVVHHLPDSHLNAYVRMKLAATEERPAVRTYDEQAWSELADARRGSVDLSLPLIFALHARWSAWLATLDQTTLARTIQHPDWGDVSIDVLIHLYAWHCRHHVAHITALKARQNWR